MELGMKHYERAYPETDIVLMEPDRGDNELYLANTFGYSRRRQMAEHAYRETRAMLRERSASLAPKFARHGVTIRNAVLADPMRNLTAVEYREGRLRRAVSSLHDVLDELGRRLQPA
jgi:NTE family protein